MRTRHQHELLARLDRVAERGSAEITHYELLLWYGQSRFSATIWRDIEEKWQEVCEEHGEKAPLLVGEGEGFWTFVWGGGLADGDDAWLTEVGKLARRKSPALEELVAA